MTSERQIPEPEVNQPSEGSEFDVGTWWHNNAFRIEDDDYVFLDPFTGDRLSNEHPPRSILADSQLMAGYQFLQEFGERVSLKIQYGSHAGSESDWEGNDFEQSLIASDIYMTEAIGWRNADHEALNRLSLQGEESSASAEYGSNELRLREMAALKGSGKPVGFADVGEGQDDLRKTFIAALKFVATLRTVSNMPEKDRERAEWINVIALESMREWFMVAQLGREVAKICQNDQRLLERLKAGDLEVLLTVGNGHRNLTSKFEGLGVKVQESSPAETVTQQRLVDGIRQGRISRQELA